MAAVLTYNQKNKLLIAGAIVLLLLAWFLAFSKTFDAISLNRRLNRQAVNRNDLGYNPESLRERAAALNRALDRFEVDSAEWRDEFWLKVSRIASVRDIDVIYEPHEIAEPDSNNVTLKQRIRFQGKYKELLLLLDSIEKVENIGRVANLKFIKNEAGTAEKETDEIALDLQFYAVNKGK